MRGKFFTFEGIDGAGKSTHIAWTAELLRSQGLSLVLTREPGGTAFGENLRELLLRHTQPIHPISEALLMFAARKQHVEEVIRPALDKGAWVLCDRFTDSSFAYQGGGRGVARDRLETLESWVHADLQPDLTLLFDVDISVGQSRVARIKSPDRFEQESSDFFARVRSAYLERARRAPERIFLIDGSQPIASIREQIEKRVQALRAL